MALHDLLEKGRLDVDAVTRSIQEDAKHWPHFADGARANQEPFYAREVPALFSEILGMPVQPAPDIANDPYRHRWETADGEYFYVPRMQEDGTFHIHTADGMMRRFIPFQLRYAHNQILYLKNKDGSRRLEIRSTYPGKPGRSTSTVAYDGMNFTVSFIKNSIPVAAILAPLTESCDYGEVDWRALSTAIGRDVPATRDWYDKDFLPNLVLHHTKQSTLRRMMENFLKPIEIDSDDLMQMEFDTPYRLIAQLLRMKMNDLKGRGVGHLKPRQIVQRLNPMIKSAFLTGRWSAVRRGVTCQLKISSRSTVVSQVRRVMARQAHTRARLVKSRMPHPSTFGFLCAGETPDGKNCGLQLTLCAGVYVYDDGTMNREFKRWDLLDAENPSAGYADASRTLLGPVEIHWLKEQAEVKFILKGEAVVDEYPQTLYEEILNYPHLSREMASVPFLVHDQGPRAYFQALMRRQFISADPPADPDAHLRQYLTAGQSPLVGRGVDDGPDGINLVIAILAHDLNMEDCLLLNQRAVDLGAFQTLAERKHILRRSKRREKIEELKVEKRQRVNERDIIIKTSEQTVRAKHDESGVVIDTQQTPEVASVTIREQHEVKDGDKLSNRHGQKGVVRVIPTVDMPWCPADGIIPDAIINPFAFPSRMTMGMIMEMLVGRKVLDNEFNPDHGRVVMCVGETGAQLAVPVTIGVCWYGRMEQIAARKINVRSGSGPTDPITGQPKRGRRVDGGAKFSLMDANAVLAHGANDFLHDRMCESSDPYTRHICAKCMLPATRDDPKQPYRCRHCKSGLWVKPDRTCQSTVVMMNELAADGISTRLL